MIISFQSGASYDDIVTNVTQQKSKAGTGLCGSPDSPTNLTCYLKTADGVLNLSADPGNTPLPDLVAFANELTQALGTS